MHTSFDIIISGGGLAGLSMALALAELPLTVAVVERDQLSAQHAPEFDGRVSAIAYGSKIMLEKLGVWGAMAPYAEPINDIRVSDNESPFFLHYDHREVGSNPFGWIVENRFTRMALYQAIKARQDITMLEQQSVTAFRADEEGAHITLKDGSMLQAKLVIAAEGKHSPLRIMAGIQRQQASYQQTAIVATIAHTLPHHGLAQERFLTRGPFAVLPMTEQRSSLVWVEPSRLAPVYLALGKEEAEQEISERVGDYLGAISLVGKLFAYPLEISVAAEMTGSRLALIGDAAHALHPIAGQGINLGFRDVAVLQEVIKNALEHGQDIGSAATLQAYRTWRSSDVLSMALVTDGLNRLFTNDSRLLKLARGLGLFGVSKTAPLKKFFMKHAMGTTGDLPDLMRI